MNNKSGLLEGDVHRLKQTDILRMMCGVPPRGLSDNLRARLERAQMNLVYSSFRSINHIAFIALPVLILLFCDLTQFFDVFWILIIAAQLVHCSYLALWMGKRLRAGKMQPKLMSLALLPAAFISGWVAGGIPGLVMENNAILSDGLNAQQTLAMITSTVWVFVGVMWTPTLFLNMITLLFGAICSLLFTYQYQNNPEGILSTVWMLNAGILLVPGYIMLSSAWMRDRLDRIVLEEQHSALAFSFSDFQDGARDWAWQTDANLLVTETPPERIEFLPKSCRPVSLDGMFDPECPDYPRLERVLLKRAEIPELRLRRLHRSPEAAPIWWHVRGQPQYGTDGRFEGYLLISSDISSDFELEKTRRELRETEELLYDITEGPKGSVRALSALVQALSSRDVELPETVSNKLQNVMDNAKRSIVVAQRLSRQRRSTATTAQPAPERPQKGGIMVVDKDDIRRRITLRHLQRGGFNAEGFGDVVAARNALEEGLEAELALISPSPENAWHLDERDNFLAVAATRRMFVMWRAKKGEDRPNADGYIDPEMDHESLLATIRQRLDQRNQAA